MSLSLKDKLRAKLPVCVAVIGDSTTCGFGANGAPNWDVNSPFVIQPFAGYVLQSVQDNLAIPSSSRLTQTWLQQLNPASKFYNLGGSGWTAQNHLSYGIIAEITARSPKPDIVILALGINSAKNNQSQGAALSVLIQQIQAAGMQAVISLGHNVGIYNTTTPMPQWQGMRAEMKSLATQYGCDLIECGSDDGAITPSLTHDGYHPSALGYAEIFKKYKEYLGGVIKIGKQSFNVGEGALRVKTTKGLVKLKLGTTGTTKIKTSAGVFAIV